MTSFNVKNLTSSHGSFQRKDDDVPEFLIPKKSYTAKQRNQFHLRKALIQACIDKAYLHPDGEIELDLRLNPRRLAETFFSCDDMFKHHNRVVPCPYSRDFLPAIPFTYSKTSSLSCNGHVVSFKNATISRSVFT